MACTVFTGGWRWWGFRGSLNCYSDSYCLSYYSSGAQECEWSWITVCHFLSPRRNWGKKGPLKGINWGKPVALVISEWFPTPMLFLCRFPLWSQYLEHKADESDLYRGLFSVPWEVWLQPSSTADWTPTVTTAHFCSFPRWSLVCE